MSAQDPNIDYVEVSPTTLLDSNRHTCDICGNGYPRMQNLEVHRRAHNLPCTLKTRTTNDPVPTKKYLCPDSTCLHHNRSHALADFGGLKKHYLRRHTTDKNHKCDTCSKAFKVHADLKAHAKTCVTKNRIFRRDSRFTRANYFTTHQDNARDHEVEGGVRTISHPQTFGTRANTNTMIINEGNNILNVPHNSYPFDASCQSQSSHFVIGYADQLQDKIPSYTMNHKDMIMHGDFASAFGTGEGRQSIFDDGSMNVQSSSSNVNLTPTRHNISLQEMYNSVTGNSVVGSYEQEGYNGYGIGKGHVEYSSEMDMLNFQHQQQQPLPNMFNPMIGSSNMGIHGQEGYKGYGLGSGYLGYNGGMETSFQQYQQQHPLQIVNPENMNVHGDWGIINGTGEGTKSYLDGVCMLDPSNMTQDVAGSSEQGGYNGLVDAATSNCVSMYEQGGYKEYKP